MIKILFILFFISTSVFAQKKEVLEWGSINPKTLKGIDYGTHGSIQEKLIENGELPDPFYGMNENEFGWIENNTWCLNSSFDLLSYDLEHDFIELEFPGIDTYAEIFLNDSLIGFAENAFRPYRYNIKNKVKLGTNKLQVIFYPPVLYHKEKYEAAAYHLPAPNDVNEIKIAPYTRKPQYQFGWDWSLRMNTIGFLKPVVLHVYNSARTIGKNIVTQAITEESATLFFELLFSNPTKGNLTWKSKIFGDVRIGEGTTKVIREEEVLNPLLWWPRGQGDQNLYEDSWQIFDEQNKLIEEQTVIFGIRQTELVMGADKWGTSYVIKVNGRPIFCKGGDYIPQDIFPARVHDEDLVAMVKSFAASNFNMVRIWGGGYYPDDAFYDACDKYGIMVWQDFMFACAMYPGDPEFLTNVQEEVEYQIPRIASHPSLTIFNGNNEVDVAWKNWGFKTTFKLDEKASKEIEESYVKLFQKLLPNSVTRLTNSPYIHTSPLSNWGKDEFFNHGTQHYWGVWHGKDPMSDFAKKIGRFNAEYGFQSFPEFSTLSTFSEKVDWDLKSDVMKHHQKSYVGNGMILKHAEILYGTPENFEEFVYFSQLTQATAVSMAVTGHRLDAPRCMGTLYWQTNDCWPAPSWSSIDYYGNWKALQYRVKEDYEGIAVLGKALDKGQMDYYLVSDQVDTFNCELKYTVFDLEGNALFQNVDSLLVEGNQSIKICDACLKADLVNENYVVKFEWKNAREDYKTRTFSQINTKYAKSDSCGISIKVKEIRKASPRQASTSSEELARGSAIIVVKTEKYLRNFWLYSNVLGVKFNKNFVDLLPGTHEFEIEFETVPKVKDFGFKWM